LALKAQEELIRSYIIRCEGKAIKNDVVNYMNSQDVPEEYRTSRVTTLNTIYQLEVTGIIKISKGKRRGQSHHLFINSDNEFNRLLVQIEELEESLIKHSIFKSRKLDGKETDSFRNQMAPLIQLTQISVFNEITDLVTSVEKNITSIDHRQTLYLKIVNLLVASKKLGKFTMPDLVGRIKLFLDDYDKKASREQQKFTGISS
jgi:hypothetical protein